VGASTTSAAAIEELEERERDDAEKTEREKPLINNAGRSAKP